ncbi:hypothetical protein Tco_1066240 [Tanacetum coccineum]|uniref:Uncharacterized protein n=1 Tax=Tanacetum coccineum TaxID=301880 RepID=A0ABQ5H9X1_9ASTR
MNDECIKSHNDKIESRNELFKTMQSLGEMLRQREQTTNLSTHTPKPSRRFNSICYDNDDDEDSTIPLNEIISQIPGKNPDEVIKSNVEDLVPIPSESGDTSDNDSECDWPFCDNSSPLDILGVNSMTFFNPLFDSNDDFISTDDESLPEEDDIGNKDSYVSNLDELAFASTPLFDPIRRSTWHASNITSGHAGDPEVSYWLKGRGANLRDKKDGLELVINQGWRLKLKDVPLLLDPSIICYKFSAGRKSRAHISGGQFVARLAKHFGLLTAEILGGLIITAPELSIIDMGPERQPDAAAGAPGVAQDAPIVDECGQADPTPVQAPPPTPTPARTMPQRMARLEEGVHEIRGALTEQREVIDAMARNFSSFSTRAITGLARIMDKAGVAYVLYSKTHVPYQRHRVRQRIGEASTSAAQQDPQQPDP